MNSNQFRRHLASLGCIFEPAAGKGGHIKIRLGNKTSAMPMHGGAKQLGSGLMRKIKKDLGVESTQ